MNLNYGCRSTTFRIPNCSEFPEGQILQTNPRYQSCYEIGDFNRLTLTLRRRNYLESHDTKFFFVNKQKTTRIGCEELSDEHILNSEQIKSQIKIILLIETRIILNRLIK